MSRGTVTLPSRSYPAIRGVHTPGLPARLPGGQDGPAPIPSRIAADVQPPRAGGRVPGGIAGIVNLFTPNVDKQAPYFIGGNEGHSVRTVDGSPLSWLKSFFLNNAGVEAYAPPAPNAPDWTSNQRRQGAAAPGSPIPISTKRLPHVTMRRAAYQDEQLFTQLTNREHPWPIQKPIPFHLRAQLRGQPIQNRPFFPRLTRYTPAASYSQTTQTIISSALANLLPAGAGTNPNTAGGSPYGSY